MKFAYLLGQRTVASIISSLASMVNQLEAHAASKQTEREDHLTEAAKHSTLASDADAEITKARAAAEKIGALINN